MNWIISAAEVTPDDRNRVGGKGYALAALAANGFTIPETVCLTIHTYNDFVMKSGLRERILPASRCFLAGLPRFTRSVIYL